MNQIQAPVRIWQIGAQGAQPKTEHVGVLVGCRRMLAITHGDRADGDQGVIGQFGMGEQPAAQRAGDHRGDHVVGRDIGRPLYRLDPVPRPTARRDGTLSAKRPLNRV